MTGSTEAVGLSVVIPAHNSSAVIENTARRLMNRLSGGNAEIIVVENGSTDNTFALCTSMAKRWDGTDVAFTVLQSEKGLGNALRVGVQASRGAHVLLTADDLPFGFDDLDGADALASRNGGHFPAFVVGSKAHSESSVERGALRGVLTWGFASLRRIVLGMRTGDPQGTVLVDGDLIRGLASDIVEPGFLFTTELVYLVEKLDIRPQEVPVRLSEDHDSHGTRVSRADVVSMGLGLFRIRKRHQHGAKPTWGSVSRSV
ncbi:glycosyltransferase [Rhodococcus sp. H36-A4]|uniref:glycosyltransferase n=1 Tax=unclassified Rhodococcus (in: high G+C Gram-positive bacteria) TaxID=192944 RepID=UPI0022AF896B|nr:MULTISPECIES: glycosyltransferase [unclassified Rhodococcus (in: high G+C Gram-positive bacteria)]MCZ4077301.1 glycosyltransferase [Rhodococcus sp. H36-A4]MDJ0359724.1 glycosyltransferase [Rhodococcus sp. H29-C3]